MTLISSFFSVGPRMYTSFDEVHFEIDSSGRGATLKLLYRGEVVATDKHSIAPGEVVAFPLRGSAEVDITKV